MSRCAGGNNSGLSAPRAPHKRNFMASSLNCFCFFKMGFWAPLTSFGVDIRQVWS